MLKIEFDPKMTDVASAIGCALLELAGVLPPRALEARDTRHMSATTAPEKIAQAAAEDDETAPSTAAAEEEKAATKKKTSKY